MAKDKMKEYDLVAFCNTLVDYVTNIDENDVSQYGLRKGDFREIDKRTKSKIESKFNIEKFVGGSGANVAYGVSNLGLNALYIATVGDDENSDFYIRNSKKENLDLYCIEKNGDTGVAVTLITPDKERSFGVFYGVMKKLKEKDLPNNIIGNAKNFFITLYAIDLNPKIAIKAMDLAKGRVCLDLSSTYLVKKNKKLLNGLLEKSDIIFANEEEANSLIQNMGGLENLLNKFWNKIFVFKYGKEGSTIYENHSVYKIPAFDVNVVNTNGAGDAYAAGFLSSLILSGDIFKAGLLGSLYASKIVQLKGARNLSKNEEIELKFNIEDTESYRRKLRKLGAVLISKFEEKNVIFDKEGKFFNENEMLRLRKRDNKVFLTYKRKLDGIRKRLEVETKVRSYRGTFNKLLNSGLKDIGTYEKLRETYSLFYDSAKVMIDRINGKDFLEIEASGKNCEGILYYIARYLGLDLKKAEDRAYAELFCKN